MLVAKVRFFLGKRQGNYLENQRKRLKILAFR